MKEKLAKLITVKSIVTLVLTMTFVYLSVIKVIDAEKYMMIFTMIISFYFGVQTSKGKE